MTLIYKKISEVTKTATDLAGLITLGVDAANEDVKIPLQLIKTAEENAAESASIAEGHATAAGTSETAAAGSVVLATAEKVAAVAAKDTALATNYAENLKARIVADSGTMNSLALTNRVYDAVKDLLPDTELLFVPECGMKVVDNKIAKLYNLVGTNDAVQATAANRPYVGGVIAPNEKAKIKAVQGQGNASLAFTAINFANNRDWTLITSIKFGKNIWRVTTGDYSYFGWDGSTFFFTNGVDMTVLFTAQQLSIGKEVTLEFRYSSGIGAIIIDGVSVVSTTNIANISFGNIGFSTAALFDGTISYFHLLSRTLSASESQSLHAFLSNEFPAIEAVPVGSQRIATSNLEATTFGPVTIPEVQGSSVETNTEKLINGGFSTADNWNLEGGASIGGGQLTLPFGGDGYQSTMIGSANAIYVRIKYEVVSNNSDGQLQITGSTRHGNSLIDAPAQTLDSTVGAHFIWAKTSAAGTCSVLEFKNVGGTVGNIVLDNASVQEYSWSDAQTIYDARITAGDTVLQANIAAGMQCVYANSADNGAIYGKLYNGFAVYVMNYYKSQGFHVPSDLEWTQLSEYLGGNTVSGGKTKALYGDFNNANSTNSSGISLLKAGQRNSVGAFVNDGCWLLTSQNDGDNTIGKLAVDYAKVLVSFNDISRKTGMSVRLFADTPHLSTDQYESGQFATDISSTPKQVRIPFGCRVKSIKPATTTNVTSIEAKLFNYAGTELETLITGKACNATTKSFAVTADQTVSYTDNYVRITAVGNAGQGMNIIITIEKV